MDKPANKLGKSEKASKVKQLISDAEERKDLDASENGKHKKSLVGKKKPVLLKNPALPDSPEQRRSKNGQVLSLSRD